MTMNTDSKPEEAITERELVKSRWRKFLRTGKSIAHSDVVAWATKLQENKSGTAAVTTAKE